MSTTYLSLGLNCQVAHHIHRKGYQRSKSPFNSSVTHNHSMVVEMLSTEFRNVLSGRHVSIGCNVTGFRWEHRSINLLSDQLKASWNKTVQAFLSKKKQKVVFIRKLKQTDKLDCQYDEIHNCLSQIGFEDFRLYFAVEGSTETTERYFPMNREPSDPNQTWTGNKQDWDDFFLYLKSQES